MPKILHLASIWKVCFHFNFTKIDPSYFFKRDFFYLDTFISQFCKHGKKTNHQMLFVLVSNHPDFYLDGPILTSNKKKKCTSKSINIVYQKMSYSILVKSMANMIHIIIVFILIQIWFFIICRLLKFITLIWIALIFFFTSLNYLHSTTKIFSQETKINLWWYMHCM